MLTVTPIHIDIYVDELLLLSYEMFSEFPVIGFYKR
jgi:hypothetical protein